MYVGVCIIILCGNFSIGLTYMYRYRTSLSLYQLWNFVMKIIILYLIVSFIIKVKKCCTYLINCFVLISSYHILIDHKLSYFTYYVGWLSIVAG